MKHILNTVHRGLSLKPLAIVLTTNVEYCMLSAIQSDELCRLLWPMGIGYSSYVVAIPLRIMYHLRMVCNPIFIGV